MSKKWWNLKEFFLEGIDTDGQELVRAFYVGCVDPGEALRHISVGAVRSMLRKGDADGRDAHVRGIGGTMLDPERRRELLSASAETRARKLAERRAQQFAVRVALIREYSNVWALPVACNVLNKLCTVSARFATRDELAAWLAEQDPAGVHRIQSVVAELTEILDRHRDAFPEMANPYHFTLQHLCRALSPAFPLLTRGQLVSVLRCMDVLDEDEFCKRAVAAVLDRWEPLRECCWVAFDLCDIVALDGVGCTATETLEDVLVEWDPYRELPAADVILDRLLAETSARRVPISTVVEQAVVALQARNAPETFRKWWRLAFAIAFSLALASNAFGTDVIRTPIPLKELEDESEGDDDDMAPPFQSPQFARASRNDFNASALTELGASAADPLIRKGWQLGVFDSGFAGTYFTTWVMPHGLSAREDRKQLCLAGSLHHEYADIQVWLQQHIAAAQTDPANMLARFRAEERRETFFVALARKWLSVQSPQVIRAEVVHQLDASLASALSPPHPRRLLMCEQCGRVDRGMMLCAACRKAVYCGLACQRAAWPSHKRICEGKKK
jgi:hypothetical protein